MGKIRKYLDKKNIRGKNEMKIEAKEIATDNHDIVWKIKISGEVDKKTYKALVELLVK